MKYRACPRNEAVRREAFVRRARELLPDLGEANETEATRRFGPRPEGGRAVARLRERLEKISRFHDWFAEGKVAQFEFWADVLPHGEMNEQFVRCWREAIKAMPTLTNRFTLRKDGFRVPLPQGHYRFERGVLLPREIDDGSEVVLDVDDALLRRGGLFRLEIKPDASRLVSLATVLARWKIALRMLRHFRAPVRPEIMRRLRAGQPLEYSRGRGSLVVTLRCGRMPKEVRDAYRVCAEIQHRRLNRVIEGEAWLSGEGTTAADEFAAAPAVQAAQAAAQRERLIAAYREARDRLWTIASMYYVKRSLPEWPFRTPDEVCGRMKAGISPRRQLRLESAVEAFRRAYAEVIECGWNPLADIVTMRARGSADSQQMLPLVVAT